MSVYHRPHTGARNRFTRTAAEGHPEQRIALESLRQLVAEMAGRKLPGERELALRLSISRQRLRSILDHLEAEGAVERVQGSGTYAVEEARGLSHVGLLIDSRLKLGDDPFFSNLTERVQLALQASGVHCVIERIDGKRRPRFLGDGIFTLGLAGLAVLEHLRADDPPAVSLMAGDRYDPALLPDAVSLLLVEDRGGGDAAARRALAEGCRRLVYVGRSDLPASRSRWEGVCQAVARMAGEGVEATIESVECSMNYQAGRGAAAELEARFGAGADGIALITANDWLAMGLRTGLSEIGSALRGRPLYSFDGLPMATESALEIRSLRHPMSLVVEDAILELRRLTRHRSGRVIRYALEWADGWRDSAPLPRLESESAH